MLTSAAVGWAIAGLLALIAGATRQYLAYRHGRQVEENANKDAKLKTVLEMHNVSKKVATDIPANDTDILDRLQLKD